MWLCPLPVCVPLYYFLPYTCTSLPHPLPCILFCWASLLSLYSLPRCSFHVMLFCNNILSSCWLWSFTGGCELQSPEAHAEYCCAHLGCWAVPVPLGEGAGRYQQGVGLPGCIMWRVRTEGSSWVLVSPWLLPVPLATCFLL